MHLEHAAEYHEVSRRKFDSSEVQTTQVPTVVEVDRVESIIQAESVYGLYLSHDVGAEVVFGKEDPSFLTNS